MKVAGQSHAAARRVSWHLVAAVLFSLAIALFCLFLALEYTSLTRNLPPIETLPLLVDPPGGLYLQPTRFYDRSGEHLILELQNPAAKGAEYLYFPNRQQMPSSTPGLIFLGR